MFLWSPSPPAEQACFPRVRGDVPGLMQVIDPTFQFSPRARGCSELNWPAEVFLEVFPACAGMSPRTWIFNATRKGFPRVRGDVPPKNIARPDDEEFSPRARGCSPSPLPPWWRTGVFPACAGMFRLRFRAGQVVFRFPRVRGDVPCTRFWYNKIVKFSPRARGCSFDRHSAE